MSENTKIEWADHTFNPWEGCTKVSPGCANCYAETRNKRWNKGESINWGKGAPRRRTSVANWCKVLKWNRDAKKVSAEMDIERMHCDVGIDFDSHWDRLRELHGYGIGRPKVFCASLADWLDDEVPVNWLRDLLDLIRATTHLDWLLLTKRPELFYDRMEAVHTFSMESEVASGLPAETASFITRWMSEGAPNNIWLGTSAEDQERWNERVPVLLEIPAAKHFVSAEPLLGPIKMGFFRPDWLIVGGESGAGSRTMKKEWVRALRDQCDERTAFFFKQWGGVNKQVAGRDLDGRTWTDFPISIDGGEK